jgi:hypothetical protein
MADSSFNFPPTDNFEGETSDLASLDCGERCDAARQQRQAERTSREPSSAQALRDDLGEAALGVGLAVATGGQTALAETALNEVNRELDDAGQKTAKTEVESTAPADQTGETVSQAKETTTAMNEELVREAAIYAERIISDLGLQGSITELRPMLKQVIKEAGQHPELLDAENRQEAILGYMAAGVWRELITRLGLADVVDTKVDGKEILQKIRAGVWAEVVPAQEVADLGQETRTEGVAADLTNLIVKTCTVGGQPVTTYASRFGGDYSPEMQKIRAALQKTKMTEGDLTNIVGDRLRFLYSLGKETQELKLEGDTQIGEHQVSDEEQKRAAILVAEVEQTSGNV